MGGLNRGGCVGACRGSTAVDDLNPALPHNKDQTIIPVSFP